MVVPARPRAVGRPASASRQEVLDLARRQFQAGVRLDLSALAGAFGLSRATLYRWFGSREGLISTVLSLEYDRALEASLEKSPGVGAARLLNTMVILQEAIASNEGLATLLQQEQEAGLRILTSSAGEFQPKVVASIATVIETIADQDGYEPPVDVQTLAYALVRLAEAFIYNDVAVGIKGDLDRLRDVEAVLIGIA